MSQKAIVFGRRGQLGTELVRVFKARGYSVLQYDRSTIDVTDAVRVEQTIAAEMPAVVLNATAYNMVDVAEREPEAAYAGNALAVRNLALACRQADARLVHFSTDYVFDGLASRPYTEEDRPHPLGAYGVSKLAGEMYAQAYLERPLIIRTCGVYGPGGLTTARGNFVETMLRLARRSEPVRVVEDYVASPTYAPELAERSADLVDKGLNGIFHIGGGTPISWFDFARIIFEEANVSPELRPTTEREHRSPARRPRYSALSNAKMESHGIRPMPPVREAVQAYMARRPEVLGSRTA
jgi:dTDP-4-dehydrorhamnose reductase